MDRFLKTVCPCVGRDDVARFSKEEYRINILFGGEQNAYLGAEGRKKDSAISSKPVDFVEDNIDKVVQFHSVGIHFPIMSFKEHRLFCRARCLACDSLRFWDVAKPSTH